MLLPDTSVPSTHSWPDRTVSRKLSELFLFSFNGSGSGSGSSSSSGGSSSTFASSYLVSLALPHA